MKILLKKHFGWFYEKLNNDAIDSYAAQVSFWILISFIPFLMLVLALLQVIRFEDTSLLVAFVQMLAPQTLISMTAITCVWSASTAMVALIKGLYSVFDVSKNHNYIFMRILAILYTVVFVMTLLVSMGLMVFGDMLYEWLITVMPPAFPTLINRFKPIMSYVLLLFFFWLMFIAIPRKQVSLRNAFFGAALASAGWVLFSFIFSVFEENFANYATIYGSLAALVILMVWLYACMFILLIGGEIAMWLQHSGINRDVSDLKTERRRRKLISEKGNDANGKTTDKK